MFQGLGGGNDELMKILMMGGLGGALGGALGGIGKKGAGQTAMMAGGGAMMPMLLQMLLGRGKGKEGFHTPPYNPQLQPGFLSDYFNNAGLMR